MHRGVAAHQHPGHVVGVARVADNVIHVIHAERPQHRLEQRRIPDQQTHLVTGVEQRPHRMRTDKPCTTGHHDAHDRPRCPLSAHTLDHASPADSA